MCGRKRRQLQKLTFTSQNYVGVGALSHLSDEIQKYEPKKVVIITDHILVELGLLDSVFSTLETNGIKYTVFSDIEPEPSVQLAQRLVDFVQEKQGDFIIGIGGGSALDLAKLSAVLSYHEGKVEQYLNLTGTKEVTERGIPKILIPTTSGTGSEVTNITVLSLETTKDVIAHDYLLADVTIVDPELTITMPKRVTAATGIDALTHAVEAYLSKNSSIVTDGLALHAVKLIARSLKKAVHEPNHLEARTDMSVASYMAGMAFFNAGVAGVHALAYPLGGQFHLPHGEANAVLLPYVMNHIKEACHTRMKDLLCALDASYTDMASEEATHIFIDKLFDIIKEVELPTKLELYSIPKDAIGLLTADAKKQTRLLARSPLELTYDDIYTIYTDAYEGRQ